TLPWSGLRNKWVSHPATPPRPGCRGLPQMGSARIGPPEDYAVDLGGKPVRSLFDDRDRVRPVLLEYLHGETRRDRMALQKQHDLLDRALLLPGSLNHLDALARDAFDLAEARNVALDHFESLL